MKAFADLHALAEDDRIGVIGREAMASGKRVAFVTDADPGKADRYVAKLLKRFPGLMVVARSTGPVAKTETVVVKRIGRG